MSEIAARPEAQEPWVIWDRRWDAWMGTGPDGGPMDANRYSHEEAALRTDEYRIAVPLSQALESGPPVEAQEAASGKLYGFDVVADPAVPKGEAWLQTPAGETFRVALPETPEERTRQEIAALPVPAPGETWYHCDGASVLVTAVWDDGPDTIIQYRWPPDRQLFARTLRSWYGYERPGVRRFQREAPKRPGVETDPYPWEGRTKITVATPNPDGWSPIGPLPLESAPVGQGGATPPDYQADVRAFHEALVPDQVADRPTMPSERVLKLRRKLIREECNELIDALEDRDMVRAVDGAGDAIWVILGTLVAMGVDLAPVWREVQRSNMAKEGGPVRADGKLLKPEGWTPPDVRGELERQGWSDNERGEG